MGTVTETYRYRVTSKETQSWGPYTKPNSPSISPGDKDLTRTWTKQQRDDNEHIEYKQKLKEKYNTGGNYDITVFYKYPKNSSTTVTIDNPLEEIASKKDAFAFDTKPIPQYYLRFGFLLNYIKEFILPKVKTDNADDYPPIFDIDEDPWSNHMFSLPNQISLDPRVCVVRNDSFKTEASNDTSVFPQLSIFREVDNSVSTNENAAYPMNIYLNFNFIIECLKTDERGDVNVYDFIKSICDGLNKALGGINNLEPVIDEESNTLKIVDTTPIPGYSSQNGSRSYTLQLYGYDKTSNGYISNFIRNVDLKTAITPEFATMVTVGATAGGYVKGTEATAFSKWNVGLTDRFKDEFIPGNPSSQKENSGVDEAEYNYNEKIIKNNGFTKRYGFTSLTKGSIQLSDDIIEGNISVGTEYFKYLIAKNKNESGGTIGFIPFKISFTMDGLSGIKIYNKLNVDTRFLPRAYGDNLDLIVTGVSHKLANNDWETDIEATVIPKTKSGGISTPSISSPLSSSLSPSSNASEPNPELPINDGLWLYLTWQQGTSGAAQHWEVAKGRRSKYSNSVPPENLEKNWPGNRVASNGVRKSDIRSLYNSNPQKLAIAFIDVQNQNYLFKEKEAKNLVTSSRKNRNNILYSDLYKIFKKYEVPNKGITADILTTFGYIENGLSTDTKLYKDTLRKEVNVFQGMFQINKTYTNNPNFGQIVQSTKKGNSYEKTYPYPGKKLLYQNYDIDPYVKQCIPSLIDKLDNLKRISGYPN